MRLITFIAVLLFGSGYTIEAVAWESKTKIHSEKIMSEFTADGFNEEFNFIKKYIPSDLGVLFTTHLKKIWKEGNLKKPVEYEFVSEEKIGKSFVRYYYLLKFDNDAYYFMLQYYQLQQKWVVHKYKFGENFEFLYEKTN